MTRADWLIALVGAAVLFPVVSVNGWLDQLFGPWWFLAVFGGGSVAFLLAIWVLDRRRRLRIAPPSRRRVNS